MDWTSQAIEPGNIAIGPLSRSASGTLVAANDGWQVWYEKQQLTIFPTKDQRRNVKPERHELPLDTSASVLGAPNSTFSSAKELGRVLANNAACQKCVVRQWFRFAFGRRESEQDREGIDRAFEDFKRSGFQFQELMISLVRSLPGDDPSKAAANIQKRAAGRTN